MNGYNLYRGALAQEKMEIEGAIIVNDDMVFVPQKYDNHFNAVVVSREDFEEMGYDTHKVNDDKMAYIAKKIGDNLVENLYWDLIIEYGHRYFKE